VRSPDLHDLARVGAELRLRSIEAELNAITLMFPDLGSGLQPRAGAAGSSSVPPQHKGRSAAARKAQSERMESLLVQAEVRRGPDCKRL
jgi:hypothetical protein